MAVDAGAAGCVSRAMRSGPVGSSEYRASELSRYVSNCLAAGTAGSSLRLGGVELLSELVRLLAASVVPTVPPALACRPLKKEARKLGPEADRVSLFDICIHPGPDELLGELVMVAEVTFPSAPISPSAERASGNQSVLVTNLPPLCHEAELSSDASLTPLFSVLTIELRTWLSVAGLACMTSERRAPSADISAEGGV